MFQIDGKYTNAVVHHDEIDETSMAQIVAMVNSPAISNPVAIMPDFHAGSFGDYIADKYDPYKENYK